MRWAVNGELGLRFLLLFPVKTGQRKQSVFLFKRDLSYMSKVCSLLRGVVRFILLNRYETESFPRRF